MGIFFLDIPFPVIVFGAGLVGFLATKFGSSAFQGGGHGGGGEGPGEAADSLRARGDYPDGLTPALFTAAVGRSITQLLSFLVNAAKGTPIDWRTSTPR